MQSILRFFWVYAALMTALQLSALTVDEVPNVHRTSRIEYVSNPSGVLSHETVEKLNSMIAQVWRQTGAEVAVVAVDAIDPTMTPEEFATALFEKWGIGKSDKDNGLLLLISRDDHAVQIRTGYGMEGVVPDIIAGRIIRDDMIPRFREGDFDGGTEAAVSRLASIITDPDARDELRSKYANDSRTMSDNDFDGDELFAFLLKAAAIVAIGMLAVLIYFIRKTRGMDDPARWQILNRLWLIYAILACITLGIGLIPFALLVWKMYRIRRHRRNCPHCGTRMELVDEIHDNDYLSPGQDLEEKLGSVDYDVWHCPKCYQTDIYPYVSRNTHYTECPRCHVRAMSLSDRRILRQPTVRNEGEGVDIYYCRNCGNHNEKHFSIPRKEDDTAALAAGALLGSMLGSRGGGFGGGGFGGGSFGGGHTGGGGAGGSW